jgi:adenylylsulfate kinase
MAGIAIWITGLPGSGKSALAEGLKAAEPGLVLLGMDELRRIATPEPSYSESERDVLYRSLVFTAGTLASLGHDVVIDATGNLRRWRGLARETISSYAEVYLNCPLEVCMQREGARRERRGAPGEIYAKGEKGWPVPGVSAPYEEPLAPELTLDTGRMGVDEGVARVRELLGKLRAGD